MILPISCLHRGSLDMTRKIAAFLIKDDLDGNEEAADSQSSLTCANTPAIPRL
jgi:hypothetical protein